MKKARLLSRLYSEFILTLIFIALVPGFLGAQNSQTAEKPESIPRVEQEITVDAALDEPAWNKAKRISINYEIAPGENVKPPVETTVMYMYSQSHLYVAFRAGIKKGERVQGHLMDRDALNLFSQEDVVGLRIDPFDDGREAFEFFINPLGVQFDAIFDDQTQSEDFSWDAIWQSSGRITPNGYVVEVAIPFESIRFPQQAGRQTWRIAAARIYPGDARYQILDFPLDFNKSSFLAQVPRYTGFEDIRRGSQFDITPTLTARKTDERPPSGGDLDAGRVSVEPGLTTSWGVTSNINLSATVNPDFSQVEADALQLQENARFVLSFPEKRPFFVEGSEAFSTPLRAVFTRTVLDPITGVKLSGKSGQNVFGTFATLDRQNALLFPSNQSSNRTVLDQNVWNTVLRYQRDAGESGNIGALYNGREASDYHNRVAGVDGFTRFWDSNSIEVQYLRSSTGYADSIASAFDQPGDTFPGDAVNVELNHRSLHWFGELEYEHVSPTFRGDGGFFPRADFRSQQAEAGYIFRGGSETWYNRMSLSGSFDRTTDFDNTLTDREWEFNVSYSGPMRTSAFTGVSFTQRRFGGRVFDLHSIFASGAINPSGAVRFDTFARYGETIDFANNRLADEILVSPDLSLRFGRRVLLNLDPVYQRLSVPGGERIFSTALLNSRLLYHFNRQTFIRGLVRYRFVDRNTNLFEADVPATDRSLFLQLLFSYKLNPESVVFFGFNNDFGDLPERDPLLTQSRTLFFKVGYVFQL